MSERLVIFPPSITEILPNTTSLPAQFVSPSYLLLTLLNPRSQPSSLKAPSLKSNEHKVTVKYKYVARLDDVRVQDLLLEVEYCLPGSFLPLPYNLRTHLPSLPKSNSPSKKTQKHDTREILNPNSTLPYTTLLANGTMSVKSISIIRKSNVIYSFVDIQSIYPDPPCPVPGAWVGYEYLCVLLRSAMFDIGEPGVEEIRPTILFPLPLPQTSTCIWASLSPTLSTLHLNLPLTSLPQVLRNILKVQPTNISPIIVLWDSTWSSPSLTHALTSASAVLRSTSNPSARLIYRTPTSLLLSLPLPPYTGRQALLPTPNPGSITVAIGNGQDFGGDGDRWDDVCHVCGLGGTLLCCLHCPKVAHEKCIQGHVKHKGWYVCPECLRAEEEEGRDGVEWNDDFCYKCGRGGRVVCCDKCRNVECGGCARGGVEKAKGKEGFLCGICDPSRERGVGTPKRKKGGGGDRVTFTVESLRSPDRRVRMIKVASEEGGGFFVSFKKGVTL